LWVGVLEMHEDTIAVSFSNFELRYTRPIFEVIQSPLAKIAVTRISVVILNTRAVCFPMTSKSYILPEKEPQIAQKTQKSQNPFRTECEITPTPTRIINRVLLEQIVAVLEVGPKV
jgi:hypothetical protein